jgi:hypothetical protein
MILDVTIDELDKLSVLMGHRAMELKTIFDQYLEEIWQLSISEHVIEDRMPTLMKYLSQIVKSLVKNVDIGMDLNPLQVEGAPSKISQNLLHGLGAIKSLFRVVSHPFSEGVRPVYELVFHVLKLLCRNNPKISMTLLKYLPQMRGHMSHKLRVTDVIVEMFQSSFDVVSSLTHEEVRFFADALRINIKPRYLSLLATLCAINGRPVHGNQATILTFLREHQDEVFSFCESEEGINCVTMSHARVAGFNNKNMII